MCQQQFSSTHCSAIEPSLECQAELKQMGIAEVWSDVDDNWHQQAAEKFDLIIMRHVFEHFLDPVEVLQKVKASLAEGGVVYIAVPDGMSPMRSLRKFWWRAVHTYYYSNATLRYLFAKEGLEFTVLKSHKHELWGIATHATSTNLVKKPRTFAVQLGVFIGFATGSLVRTVLGAPWRVVRKGLVALNIPMP